MTVLASRADAARQLAARLDWCRGQNPLVLGVPRGGAPMGRILAERLEGRLDLVLVARLCHPRDAGQTLGAVSEGGNLHLLPGVRRDGVSEGELEREAHRQLATLRQLRQHYTPGRGARSPMGRITVVVDDGSASGATLASALDMIRRQRPARLVAALGVAAADTAERLREQADELVCLLTPPRVAAVADFYREFPALDERQVLAALGDADED